MWYFQLLLLSFKDCKQVPAHPYIVWQVNESFHYNYNGWRLYFACAKQKFQFFRLVSKLHMGQLTNFEEHNTLCGFLM